MSAKKPQGEKIGSVPPFGLRMLPELKARVEGAAAQSKRSVNAEIVARLERTFSQDAMAEFEDRIREADETGVSLPRKPGEPLKFAKVSPQLVMPPNMSAEEFAASLRAATEGAIERVVKRLVEQGARVEIPPEASGEVSETAAPSVPDSSAPAPAPRRKGGKGEK
jgi:hypothetical protein